MKLSPRERQIYELGWTDAAAQRARDTAGTLRSLAATGRSQAQQTGLLGRLRSALMWEVTEAWCARLEQLAGQLDRQHEQLRVDRDTRAAALDRAKSWLPWKRG